MSILDYNIEQLCDFIREKNFSFETSDQLKLIETSIPKFFEIFGNFLDLFFFKNFCIFLFFCIFDQKTQNFRFFTTFFLKKF